MSEQSGSGSLSGLGGRDEDQTQDGIWSSVFDSVIEDLDWEGN